MIAICWRDCGSLLRPMRHPRIFGALAQFNCPDRGAHAEVWLAAAFAICITPTSAVGQIQNVAFSDPGWIGAHGDATASLFQTSDAARIQLDAAVDATNSHGGDALFGGGASFGVINSGIVKLSSNLAYDFNPTPDYPVQRVWVEAGIGASPLFSWQYVWRQFGVTQVLFWNDAVFYDVDGGQNYSLHAQFLANQATMNGGVRLDFYARVPRCRRIRHLRRTIRHPAGRFLVCHPRITRNSLFLLMAGIVPLISADQIGRILLCNTSSQPVHLARALWVGIGTKQPIQEGVFWTKRPWEAFCRPPPTVDFH